jgi:hypothetical protein
MKINIRFMAVVLIAFALTLMGCETTGDIEETVVVTSVQENITLYVDEVLDYDYTQLFTITSGTSDIEVLKEYLDLTNIKAEVGTYFILCTYKNKMASMNVQVVKKTTVKINLTTNEEVVVNNSLDSPSSNETGFFTVVTFKELKYLLNSSVDSNDSKDNLPLYKEIINSS